MTLVRARADIAIQTLSYALSFSYDCMCLISSFTPQFKPNTHQPARGREKRQEHATKVRDISRRQVAPLQHKAVDVIILYGKGTNDMIILDGGGTNDMIILDGGD